MKKFPLLIILGILFFVSSGVQASTLKLPDLRFNSQGQPVSGTSNSNYKIIYQLENIGTTALIYSKPIKVTCYNKNIKKIYDSDFSVSSASLDIGKTTIKKAFITSLQSFPVLCAIDINNKIKELNENNNTMKFNVPVLTNTVLVTTGSDEKSALLNNGCSSNTHPDPTLLNVCLCDTGYKKNISNNTCEKIICPVNSSLEGNNCSCDYGYKKNISTNVCESFICPSDSSLDPIHGNICMCTGVRYIYRPNIYHPKLPSSYYWNSVTNTCEKCTGGGIIHLCGIQKA